MLKQNILLVTSGHKTYDDRMFYHMAYSLVNKGHKVQISSSIEDVQQVEGTILLKSFDGTKFSKRDKMKRFNQIMCDFIPNTIIASEPFPLLAAYHYKKQQATAVRIIYDITEWYPSKKNLRPFSVFSKFFIAIKLALFNLYCASKADAFIFGEHYKRFPYRQLFPQKPFSTISYYPHLKYITWNTPVKKLSKLTLGYTGNLSAEKGFVNFINSVKAVHTLRPDMLLNLTIIGFSPTKKDQIMVDEHIANLPNSIVVKQLPLQKFTSLSRVFLDIDVFFDLRKIDFENTHCLPIKLFFYAACGKPVIYSDLKAIKKEVEVESFGFLVNPDNEEEVANHIINYYDDDLLYETHCKNARKLAVQKYNWGLIEQKFIHFIQAYS